MVAFQSKTMARRRSTIEPEPGLKRTIERTQKAASHVPCLCPCAGFRCHSQPTSINRTPMYLYKGTCIYINCMAVYENESALNSWRESMCVTDTNNSRAGIPLFMNTNSVTHANVCQLQLYMPLWKADAVGSNVYNICMYIYLYTYTVCVYFYIWHHFMSFVPNK